MSGILSKKSMEYTASLVNSMLTNFEGINGTNLDLAYSPDVFYAEMIQGVKRSTQERAGRLDLGSNFFVAPKEYQQAVLAHEFGHLEQFLKLDQKSFDKIDEIELQRTKWLTIPKEEPIENIPFEAFDYAHWYVGQEIYADNKAADLGLAVPMINILEMRGVVNVCWLYDYSVKKRVENLKGKLREEILR